MFRCGWGGALAATPQAWGRMGFTGFTRFTTTELHSSISAARAAPSWTQWQRKRHHCLLEPLNAWTRARETRWSKISKMIRCEKAKKEAKGCERKRIFCFKKCFLQKMSDLKGLWSFPGGQSPRRSDRPEAGPSGIMNLVSLVLWSCHLGSQSFWTLQMWKQGLRVDNVDD